MGKKTLLNKLSREIFDRIYALSKKDLKRLVEQTNKVTQTNCGWYEYELAPAIREIANIRLDYLEKAKKLKAEKP